MRNAGAVCVNTYQPHSKICFNQSGRHIIKFHSQGQPFIGFGDAHCAAAVQDLVRSAVVLRRQCPKTLPLASSNVPCLSQWELPTTDVQSSY